MVRIAISQQRTVHLQQPEPNKHQSECVSECVSNKANVPYERQPERTIQHVARTQFTATTAPSTASAATD